MGENTPFFGNRQLVGNNFGFLGRALSRDLDQADAVVLGAPYDMATSGRAGTRHGPEAVRRASANLRWEEPRWPWNFDLFERLRVIDHGDIEFPTGDHATFDKSVTSLSETISAAGKSLLTIGGDHYVTLPLLRGVAQTHGKLALIHFDAHADTWEPESVLWNHGSMFWSANNEGLFDPRSSVQIGIRTGSDSESMGFTVIDGAMANDLNVADMVAEIRSTVGDSAIYLTFDIDCLDPAFAPGTGTPVAGGISTDRAMKILRGLTGLNIVAADVMEVAPAYDHAEITSLAAATLAYEMLYLFASRD